MENIHFKVKCKYERCSVYTMHPDYIDKAEFNIFGVPERDMTRVMFRITEKMSELGNCCDFTLVKNN